MPFATNADGSVATPLITEDAAEERSSRTVLADGTRQAGSIVPMDTLDRPGSKAIAAATKDASATPPDAKNGGGANRAVGLAATFNAPPAAITSPSTPDAVGLGVPAPSPAIPAPASLGQTASASGAAPTPIVAPDDAASQVVRAVAASDARSVEVRMDPPSLGRVRIEFDFSGETVRAVVSAVEPDTLHLLKRGGAALLRDLAEAGMGDVSLDFAEAGGGDEARTAERPFAPVALASERPDGASTARPRIGHDGRLDLRL